MLDIDAIYQGDCLELMKEIEDKSIDMILCDLPYGTTGLEWDYIIDLDLLWKEYKRIIKFNCAIVLTAREPFTSMLVNSNIKNYKHKWIWDKGQSGSYHLAKYMPLQIDEDILVFCNGTVRYYPIMIKGKMRKKGGGKVHNLYGDSLEHNEGYYSDQYYPTNILYYSNSVNKQSRLHPTQKPLELFEYLIKTYTNEGDLVLDNCAGSCTTAVAAMNTNRHYICIELLQKYVDIGNKRVEKAKIIKDSQPELALTGG